MSEVCCEKVCVNAALFCVFRLVLGTAEAYVTSSFKRIVVRACARSQLVRGLVPRAAAHDAEIARSRSLRVVRGAGTVIGWIPPILHPLGYVPP